MIAPNLWIDPRNGNNYFLTVQYPEAQIRSIQDLRSIPLHADGSAQPTRLDMIANIERIKAPTEVDHYQIAASSTSTRGRPVKILERQPTTFATQLPARIFPAIFMSRCGEARKR